MNQPFVSVIVPFYNLEGIVFRCLNSLLNQTYHNYEVICIDDGSTDGTLRELTGFSESEKLHVFTKANGGLSDARNFGVGKAKGDYISFVDGDDVVSLDYLETLVKGIKPGKDTLVAAASQVVDERKANNSNLFCRNGQPTFIEHSSAGFVNLVLANKITESAWCKLAPRHVYKENPFPTGKIYEDLATIAEVIISVECFVTTDYIVHAYVQRSGSIVRRKEVRLSQVVDYLDAQKEFNAVVRQSTIQPDSRLFAYRNALSALRIHALLGNVARPSEEIEQLDSLLLEYVRKSMALISASSALSFGTKGRMLIFSISPALHDALLRLKPLVLRLGSRRQDG